MLALCNRPVFPGNARLITNSRSRTACTPARTACSPGPLAPCPGPPRPPRTVAAGVVPAVRSYGVDAAFRFYGVDAAFI